MSTSSFIAMSTILPYGDIQVKCLRIASRDANVRYNRTQPMTSPSTATLRHDWSLAEIEAIYAAPLPDLLLRAQHGASRASRAERDPGLRAPQHQDRRLSGRLRLLPAVARATRPASRASHFLSVDESSTAAREARESGATRFCMGAAWREVAGRPAVRPRARHGPRRARARHGSLLHARHADRGAGRRARRGAGLTAYNHNLDTSRRVLRPNHHHAHLRRSPRDASRACSSAGITVCCGGIIGMGESRGDRYRLLQRAGHARSASGKRADQPAGRRRRYAARRSAARGSRSSWSA